MTPSDADTGCPSGVLRSLIARNVLQIMADIAAVAGAEILDVRSRGISGRLKADQSPVTDADERAERLILGALERELRAPSARRRRPNTRAAVHARTHACSRTVAARCCAAARRTALPRAAACRRTVEARCATYALRCRVPRQAAATSTARRRVPWKRPRQACPR